ncbi:MAG: hypothetical protein ABSG88_23700 [Bradyrhizobium sp.]
MGDILNVEASMHAPYDRSRKGSTRTEPKSGAGFLILPVLMAIALITLAIVHPKASVWISQAVQAEFGGDGIALDMPVETAQPGMTAPVRTVNAR